MRWARYITRIWEKRIRIYKILVENPEGRKHLRTVKYIWEDNIKIYFGELEWGYMNWTNLDQDGDQWRALVNAVMYSYLRVP
jgi:hypothetical protein